MANTMYDQRFRSTTYVLSFLNLVLVISFNFLRLPTLYVVVVVVIIVGWMLCVKNQAKYNNFLYFSFSSRLSSSFDLSSSRNKSELNLFSFLFTIFFF